MNWEQLLDDYNIPFVDRGPNTRKGEVSVRCPWCGEDDPSEHMGIVLEREAWGCHRNQAHRGKSPFKLIQALLGCSYGQAKLVVAQYNAADPETLDQALAALTGEGTEYKETMVGKLEFPPEFKKIRKHKSTGRFWEYLKSRGFDSPGAVVGAYGLQCCSVGRWKDRIIIPVKSAGELVAWTGRALQKSNKAPRYLSTSDAIKTVLFNEAKIMRGGYILFVTEGPFDAMKVDYYLSNYFSWHMSENLQAVATCTFGTSITVGQLGKLRALTSKFHKVAILLDRDAAGQAMELVDMLPGAVTIELPSSVGDPGDMTKDEVRALLAVGA